MQHTPDKWLVVGRNFIPNWRLLRRQVQQYQRIIGHTRQVVLDLIVLPKCRIVNEQPGLHNPDTYPSE